MPVKRPMSQPIVHKFDIEMYTTLTGKTPYFEWINSLSKSGILAKIHRRLHTVQLGNLGVYKNLKEGLYELKIFHGPGYRIYFAFLAVDKILILTAGTKNTQQNDIDKARRYWSDYKS